MAKKRKTKEQKHHADLRHNFVHQEVLNTFEAKLSKTKIEPVKSVTYASYPFLVKDLTKTFSLTGAIIAAQIVLFFILKSHLIRIPGLPY